MTSLTNITQLLRGAVNMAFLVNRFISENIDAFTLNGHL